MVTGDLRRQIRDAEAKGRPAKQAELLKKLCDGEPNDLRSRHRLGLLLKELGDQEGARIALQQCASGYAAEGFVNRSIQIVKTLLEMNSADQAALRALQGLYARRQAGDTTAGAIPGFEPPPFDLTLPGGALIDQHSDEFDAGGRTAGRGISAVQSMIQARSGGEEITIAPERDLGELVVNPPPDEGAAEGEGNSVALPLFSALPGQVQREIVAAMTQHRFGRGQIIFEQGSSDSKLWLIRDGSVEIRRRDAQGDHVVLAKIGRGAVLGEMGIFSDAPRSATASTLTETSAYSMGRKELEKLWTEYPIVRRTLLNSYRMRHLANLIAHAPFMKCIPSAHRRGVAMLFRAREVPAGAVLVDGAGEDVGAVFGILGGRVRVEQRLASGEWSQMAVISQGTLFGYGRCLFGETEPFRYVANGRSSILRMAPQTMEEIMRAHAPLKDYLEQTLQRRLTLAETILASQSAFQC